MGESIDVQHYRKMTDARRFFPDPSAIIFP